LAAIPDGFGAEFTAIDGGWRVSLQRCHFNGVRFGKAYRANGVTMSDSVQTALQLLSARTV
jgi:hypothetical protein